MEKYWYLIEKERNILNIYYKLEDEHGEIQMYKTHTKTIGNKKVKLVRALMRNDWPIVTKRLSELDTKLYDLEIKNNDWKEVDKEEMLGYLRRGNPDDNARISLFTFFGYNIFGLTELERKYFKASFSNLERLVAFYHAIKKECRSYSCGYTYRSFRGKSLIITPGKIKKAILELFGVDPKEVLYKNGR